MKNILFVSIAFPPKSDAECLQVAKYLGYLLRESQGKFNIDAVTSRQPTINMPYDESLEASLSGVRDIIEIPIYENRYTNFLLKKIAPWVINSPDTKFSFHFQAKSVIKQLPNKPDLIYSRSFPPSSAVMAHKLKIYYDVPWIMHLSDIWADCPESKYTGRIMSCHQKIEALCFNSADVVCVTSEMTLAFYEKKYGKTNARIEYYPNVFDIEDFFPTVIKQAASKLGKLRIVHTGSLAGDRTPESFLMAVKSLPRDKQNELEIIFAGAIDAGNKAIFDRYKSDCVTYIGRVEYQRALEIQRSADVLLLIDMPAESPELRVFFPSKILDYIIAKHPILALIDNHSEVERVIEKHGLGTCIERHNVKGLSDHLLWLLSNRCDSYFNDRKLVMEFDSEINAKRLINLFDEYL